MIFLITCENEEDSIKNEGARVFTTLYIDFSDAQGQIPPQSVVESCRNSFVYVLVTCNNEEDSIKGEGARVFTRFLQLYESMGVFQTLKGT